MYIIGFFCISVRESLQACRKVVRALAKVVRSPVKVVQQNRALNINPQMPIPQADKKQA